MPTFTYPSNAEINEIAQAKLPRLEQDRKIFEIMPIEEKDASLILWDQRDNYTGLQNLRGINGSPPLIRKTGAKQYQERPGYYGEGELIDEIDLTERRKLGTFGEPASIDDLTMQIQDKLLQRRLDRIEWIGWTLLTTGQFVVSTGLGTVAHQGAYALQSYTAAIPWSTVATATPLGNLRAMKLLGRAFSTVFNRTSTLYINQVTANNLISNTNAADLYGRRTSGLGTFNNLLEINQLVMGDDLPTIEVYDEGYLNDSNTFVPFIADGKGVLVGKRPANAPVAKYIMTRNANNPTMAPGAYMYIKDYREEGDAPSIGVYDTHNGGPIVEFPGSIILVQGL